VLGAFLAVPLVAALGRVIDYARGRPPAAGPGSEAENPAEALVIGGSGDPIEAAREAAAEENRSG
jgi:hypothetical protein